MRKLLYGLLAATTGFAAMHLFNSQSPSSHDDGQKSGEGSSKSSEPDEPHVTIPPTSKIGATGETAPPTPEMAAPDGDLVRLPWVVAAACIDQGPIRKQNEDRLMLQRSADGKGLLVAVSDGMGGHKAGDVAAQTVVDELRAAARNAVTTTPQASHALLLETFHRANASVRAKGEAGVGGKDMGATCVAAWFAPEACVHLYTGDSRLYHVRGGALLYRTRDHSLVQAMIETGVITPAQARTHPMRSWLSSSLGGGHEDFDAEPRWNAEGDDQPALLQTRPGDFLLLCSDGLHGELEDEEILVLMNAHGSDPARLAKVCVETALAAGGRDNVAVIAVRVTG